jgi:hypothetical protein
MDRKNKSNIFKQMKTKSLLLIVLLFFMGCSQGDVNPPARPNDVPKNARWGGGVDGGRWFSCEKSNKEWHYHCAVYDDNYGKVVDEGEYVLKSYYWSKEKGEAVIENLSSTTFDYSYFDGDTIGLVNSIALIKEESTNPGQGR